MRRLLCTLAVAVIALPLMLLLRQPLGRALTLARVSAAGLDGLAVAAVSRDRPLARAAIVRLRSRGPAGLDALFRVHAPAVAAGRAPTGDWRYLREAFDQVAAQRDAWYSQLYWYTDLAAAQAAAEQSGRPILSLRLLGRLDQELSCANSRMFRTVLYADPSVSALMREDFILHWQSVRPAPRLEVDFGDGRKLVTTITGNSLHLVLTPDGRPVDALAGLYGARPFLAALADAGEVARQVRGLPEAQREAHLAAHHCTRLEQLDRELADDLNRLGLPPTPAPPRLLAQGGSFTSFPDATKNQIELPYLRALVPGTVGLGTSFPDELWSRLSELHADEFTPGERSRGLAASKKLGGEGQPMRVPAASAGTLEPMFEALGTSLAHDTLRNQQVYHRTVHEWFVSGDVPGSEREFQERVYRELFLSESSDGWLGLVPPDAYDGLDAEPALPRSPSSAIEGRS